jgi:hypothetical protein
MIDASSTRILGGILRDCSNISKLNLSLDSGEAAVILFDSLCNSAALKDLSVELSGSAGKAVDVFMARMLK